MRTRRAHSFAKGNPRRASDFPRCRNAQRLGAVRYGSSDPSILPARLGRCGRDARAPFFVSPDPLEVAKWPALIEVGLGRLVQSEISEPAFARDSRNPVRLESCWRCRAAINIY